MSGAFLSSQSFSAFLRIATPAGSGRATALLFNRFRTESPGQNGAQLAGHLMHIGIDGAETAGIASATRSKASTRFLHEDVCIFVSDIDEQVQLRFADFEFRVESKVPIQQVTRFARTGNPLLVHAS